MGIFDFFKRKKEIKAEEKEKIKFENLESWLAEERKRSREKEISTVNHISSLISQLVGELKEEARVIKEIDINKKKAEEKIKRIVAENLSNYSGHIERLIKWLENIKKESIGSVVGEINRIFFDFKKKSTLSFEKARFLIGKELGDVKESIGKFFRGLNEIVEEEKGVIQKLRALGFIENKIAEVKKTEKIKSDVMKEIGESEKEIKNLEEKSKRIEKMIEDIKGSSEYIEEEKKKEEARLEKKRIEKEIFELKGMIDLKSLAKTFHENEKKMRIIKSYDADFNQIFEKEDSEIISLLDETKKETVKSKIKDINEKKDEIQGILSRRNKIEDIGSEIVNIRAGIKNLGSEKMKKEKRIEKFDEDLKMLKDGIIDASAKINVKIE